MKKIFSYIALISIILSCCSPMTGYFGSQKVYAAEEDLSDVTIVDNSQSTGLVESEVLRPVGGVSEDIIIDLEWDPAWETEAKGEKKRGGSNVIETKDPDGKYTAKSDGSGSYGYDHLTELQKTIYDALETKVNEFMSSENYGKDLDASSAAITSTVNYTDGSKCTLNDLNTARVAFRYDNPQHFFLSSTYSRSINTDGSSTTLILYVDPYYYTAKSRQDAQSKIDEIGSEWINELQRIIADDSKNGEYLAAVYAHNLIIETINYAYVPNTNTPQPARWAHSMAGVFTGQGVVCEGYARAYQYLLNMCGIDNIYIVGNGGQSGRDSGGHAWNCFCIDGKWYPVDLTWDDLGKDEEGADPNDMWYSYFAIPGSEFNKDHIANNMGEPGMYAIPDFSEDDDLSYYKYFCGYGNGSIDDTDKAHELYDAAAAVKPNFTEYLYFSVANSSEYGMMKRILDTSVTAYQSPYFKILFRVEYTDDIKTPATELTLSDEELTIEVDASAEITATIPEGSDDRVAFSLDSTKYCTIRVKDNKVTITGKKNGKATLTARTVKGKAAAACEITIGTGIPDPDDVYVWQNGGKDYKKFQLVTSLTATTWKDSKGKSKPGKLVWIASDNSITIEFDREKHKVLTKTKPVKGSVSNKGIVTAKEAGKLYVYCCDTGSFDVEKFVVDVLASPSKLFLGKTASVQDSKEALKKFVLNVGETGKVYICPFVKDGTADESNEYTVSIAKAEQEKYVSISSVNNDGKNGIYFTVTALDFDQSKSKAVSVKIEVKCIQSGKKASVTAVVCNPVQNLEITELSGSDGLLKKKDSVSMKLVPVTCIDEVSATTDKLKVYVGNTSVSLDSEGKKVIADKGATVKAKFDSKTNKLTLTASQNAGATAVVCLAATNPQTKKTTLFTILQVDAEGKITMSGK